MDFKILTSVFICRVNLAFTYYGIVLMTTEMYQGLNESEESGGGSCNG